MDDESKRSSPGPTVAGVHFAAKGGDMEDEKNNSPEIRFGDFLKQRREELGVSQGVLAERIGLDRTHLSTIESRRGNPNFSTILSIVRGLNLSLPDFFSGDKLPEKESPKIEVIFGATVSEKFNKEKAASGHYAIPIIADYHLIMDGTPDEERVKDYFVMPRTWQQSEFAPDMACVETTLEPHALAIINLKARTPQDGHSYLMVDDGKVFIGRAYQANNIMTLIERGAGDAPRPIYVLGRRGPRPKILGQVLYQVQAAETKTT